MEELWDYECRIAPSETTADFLLNIFATVDGNGGMYVRSRQRTTLRE